MMSITHEDSQLVCTAMSGTEVLGYVAIDSTVGGRSCGGLRMMPDVDEAEIRGLARTMTLKYGFLGLPQGGAKAGVRGAPEAPRDERMKCLREFGTAIAPLLQSRIYVPGTDMGTGNDDIRQLLATAGVEAKRRELRGTQSGDYTALTVFTAAREAARYLEMQLSDCSIAIQGFGNVGRPLAGFMVEAGASVVAISTAAGALYNPEGLDVGRIATLVGEQGSGFVTGFEAAERLKKEALLELPVDILCPCARHGAIHSENAARIQARIVCPGANNPVDPEAETRLHERGILSVPDFVANSGGVLGGTMEFAAIRRPRIEDFVDHHIGSRVAWLLQEAERQSVLPRTIAVSMALQRLEQLQLAAAHPSFKGRMMAAGLELYRRGWVPSSVVAVLSPQYFASALAR